MSLFQDVISKAQSAFAPTPTAHSSPKQQDSAFAKGPAQVSPTNSAGEPSLFSKLFSHLADFAGNDLTAAAAPAAADSTPDPVKARAAKRGSMTGTILDEARKRHDENNAKLRENGTAEKDLRSFGGLNPAQIEARIHAKMIHEEYKSSEQIEEDKKNFDPKAPVGNLQTPEERMKFLQQFNQNGAKDPSGKDKSDVSESACAPTVIIAAAVAMDGAKGLSPIIDSMKKDLKDPASLKQLAQINAKIAKNDGLTMGDMQALQNQLFHVMNQRDLADKSINHDENDTGLDMTTIRKFMDGVEMKDKDGKKISMSNKLEANGMQVRGIDNDGDATLDHAVLDMTGASTAGGAAKHMVYDPYARNGGQLVSAADQVGDYDGTTKERV